MAKIRILSNRGKEAFIDYLQTVRNGSDEPPPMDRLGREPWSGELSPVIEVSNAPLATRLELGGYLVNLFETSGLTRKQLIENTGLWSWLALLWFDLICPKEENGIRKVRETARYICSAEWRNYYRHLIAASWDIYHMYRESSRLFLWCKPHTHNDFMEQLASRQDIITTKTLIEAVDRLYWDSKMKRPKVNATNRKVAGNIRRLLSVANQLKLTYDLHSMSASEIIKLLPHEFNSWR